MVVVFELALEEIDKSNRLFDVALAGKGGSR
ncbi:hypothetical protein swp_0236 [Shewanella piezotolerans WP3]|uniref:Uncharacterized protein n=1 Tax=Shewanella piezotolerans (strain WP3 / JCM 13877) TaxID=225849 RepID=B8CHF2_SHEPW|nr:hypothetical protein swp_0236 [Shewanella piezotolerans WP3]